jgi:hypothetical protein
MKIIDYTHPALNEEITAIGGHFVLIKENRLYREPHEILYYVGYAVVDTSCCGLGGTAFAWVAGYIHDWQYRWTADGRPVSRIEPIRNESVKRDLSRSIKATEGVVQVNFHPH